MGGTGHKGGQKGAVIGQSAQDMGGQYRHPIGCSEIRISCLRNCRIAVCDKISQLADKLAARERAKHLRRAKHLLRA